MLALVAGARAQSFTIKTPQRLMQCEPVLISWKGGQGPYTLSVVSASSPSGPPMMILGDSVRGSAYSWKVNVPADTGLILDVQDSTGAQAQSDALTVSNSSAPACPLVLFDNSSPPTSNSTSDGVNAPLSTTTSEPLSTTAASPSPSPTGAITPSAHLHSTSSHTALIAVLTIFAVSLLILIACILFIRHRRHRRLTVTPCIIPVLPAAEPRVPPRFSIFSTHKPRSRADGAEMAQLRAQLSVVRNILQRGMGGRGGTEESTGMKTPPPEYSSN